MRLGKTESPTTVPGVSASALSLPLLPGSRGEAVTVAQIALGAFLAALTDLPSLAASGVYDDATARAVSLFRAIHLLPPGDGIDLAVWNRLFLSQWISPSADLSANKFHPLRYFTLNTGIL